MGLQKLDLFIKRLTDATQRKCAFSGIWKMQTMYYNKLH
jgi:hypothetical protein